MKITKSRLKKIIAEEVQRVRENVGGDSRLSFSPEEISAIAAFAGIPGKTKQVEQEIAAIKRDGDAYAPANRIGKTGHAADFTRSQMMLYIALRISYSYDGDRNAKDSAARDAASGARHGAGPDTNPVMDDARAKGAELYPRSGGLGGDGY